MRPDDFFLDTDTDDPWSGPRDTLDEELISRVSAGMIVTDRTSKSPALLLVHDEYEERATSDAPRLIDDGSRATFRALRSVLSRLGITFSPPFEDFTWFYKYWRREGMTGSRSWDQRSEHLAGFPPARDPRRLGILPRAATVAEVDLDAQLDAEFLVSGNLSTRSQVSDLRIGPGS